MSGGELSLEGFLNDVNPAYRGFAGQTHDYLIQNGCKIKLKLAKNGYLVSYSHPKGNRVILNFVFRKSGLVARIYGDNVNGYIEFLETLPEGMLKSITKSPDCRRLINPLMCNPNCGRGYDFTVNGERRQKCRYNCFMFEVNDISAPYIKAFLEKEISERAG